jgi:hypothetical protein
MNRWAQRSGVKTPPSKIAPGQNSKAHLIFWILRKLLMEHHGVQIETNLYDSSLAQLNHSRNGVLSPNVCSDRVRNQFKTVRIFPIINGKKIC